MCALFLLKMELKYAHDFNILVHNILVIVFFFGSSFFFKINLLIYFFIYFYYLEANYFAVL